MNLNFFKLNNKGMFFTTLSIIMVGLLIFTFSLSVSYKFSDQMELESSRIIGINRFVRNLDNDIQKAAYIAGFRALLAQLDYITDNGGFISDSELAFKELILNGTLNGEIESKMNGSTISDWYAKFKQKALETGILLDINVNNIYVNQEDSWNINILLDVDLNVSDDKDLAYWNINKNISAPLNIVGFEDPIHLIKTYGRIPRYITPLPYSEFDVNTTKTMFIHNYYRSSTSGPSYLQRLEGDFSSSNFGIEYFVDVKELYESGLESLIYNRSSVDYLYWTGVSSTNYKIDTITNAGYPNFLLDQDNLEYCNVEDYAYN